MMNFLKKSLSLEIENFTALFRAGNVARFTKSAFVQARGKVRPEVFDRLSRVLLHEFYTDNAPAIKLWKGFRLLAVDGSRITLPITKELKRIYGEAGNQTGTAVVQARCSVIYDVLNRCPGRGPGPFGAGGKGAGARPLGVLRGQRSGDL